MTDDITQADRPWYWDVTWAINRRGDDEWIHQEAPRTIGDIICEAPVQDSEVSRHRWDDVIRDFILAAPATARERDELRQRLERVEGALRAYMDATDTACLVEKDSPHREFREPYLMAEAALAEGGGR